ncbi:MAG TPA: DegT/DnrJ/EryC1/StrS family aminotransferase [Candidatus Nanoarchaeia archaeon]|nr:DegT/DnrJ/EryC1/StrS family aminotransferase [Candidatus Nanoarchaeia archaeon]
MRISHQRPTPAIRDVVCGLVRYISGGGQEDALAGYLPPGSRQWVSSGRHGIELALRQIPRKRVLLPAFTCEVVLDACRRAGKDIIFVDSGVLLDIPAFRKAAAKNKRSALVLPYNFGFLPDMGKVTAICKKYDITLVEDCCQALGATWKGKAAGSFGEYAVYSFGISKNIGYANGMVVGARQIPEGGGKYPLPRAITDLLQGLLNPVFFHPAAYPMTEPLLAMRLGHEHQAMQYRDSGLGRAIVLQQAGRYAEIMRTRKENAAYCLKELKGIIDFAEQGQGEPAWLYFVLLHPHAGELRQELRRRGVDVRPLHSFRDLSGKGKLAKQAEQHLAFSLYRSRGELEIIVKQIKEALTLETPWR